MEVPKKDKEDKENIRSIDRAVEETYLRWGKTLTLIKKTKIRTWKGVFLIAFAAGSFSALIWSAAVNIQIISQIRKMLSSTM